MGLQSWLNKNKIHRFEGEQGLENLEKVLRQCGYKDDNCRNGSILENFLQDNPGAMEALLNFVEEYHDDSFDDGDDEHEDPDFDDEDGDDEDGDDEDGDDEDGLNTDDHTSTE